MMSPKLRKFAFTVHVTFSMGWFGAVIAYLALAVVGLRQDDLQTVRSCYFAMELIGWYVAVPLALASLSSGLIQSLGTAWGLFRYYWVIAKLGLTVVATGILLGHMRTVSRTVALLSTVDAPADLGMLRTQLVVHPAGGLIVLLIVTILAIYKPWGRTSTAGQ